MTQTPRFKIGTTYRPVGQKNDTVHTVVDVWVTRDSKGEIVQIRYVSEHTFCGPILKTYDVLETTIARGLIAEGTVEADKGSVEGTARDGEHTAIVTRLEA